MRSAPPTRTSGVRSSSCDSGDDGTAAAWVVVGFVAMFLAISMNVVAVPTFAEFYDARRSFQIGLFAAVAVVLVSSRRFRSDVMRIFVRFPFSVGISLAVIAVLGVASAVRSPLPMAGFREVALLGLVALLAVAVAATRSRLRVQFDVVVFASLVAATLAYAVFFVVLRRTQISLFGLVSLDIAPWQQFYGWSNARFFGQVAVWTLPLLVAAPILLRDRTRVTRAASWSAGVALWALMLEAGGRGSILFTVVAVIAVVIVFGRSARGWARSAAVVLGAGTALWYAAAWVMNAAYGATGGLSPGVERAIARGGSDNFRFSFWAEALEMIAARPLLGVGPEHYAYYQRAFTAAHPHNAPLQLAAEWGLPVALGVTLLAGWGLLAWVRRWRSVELEDPQATLVAALTASVLAASALALVDGVIVTPGSQVMLALVVGWMLALYVGGGGDRSSRTWINRKWAHAGLAIIPMLLVSVLVASASPYLFAPQQTFYDQVEHLQPEKITPRFWGQGRLFDE